MASSSHIQGLGKLKKKNKLFILSIKNDQSLQ